MGQKAIPDEFSNQLKFLSKIEVYENKNELSRFLLITSFGGLLCIISGILELVFYKFYQTDVVYFQYKFLNSSEPILLLAIWVLTIFPILIIIVFTAGTSGIVNWNKTYRIIGPIAIVLFFSCEALIVLLGEDQIKVIPLLWGLFIFIGFILASYLMKRFEQQTKLSIILIALSIFVLIDSIVTYLFIESDLAMFSMLTGFGVIMTVVAIIVHLLETKYSILEMNGSKAED